MKGQMKWSVKTVLLAVGVCMVTFATTNYLMKAGRHAGLREQPGKSGVTSQPPAEIVTGKLSSSHAYLHESVTALAREGNILWVGTHDDGLVRMDTATGNQTRFDRKNGLPSDGVLDIVVDRDGVKWVATTNGISRFDNRSWKTYHPPDMGIETWMEEGEEGEPYFNSLNDADLEIDFQNRFWVTLVTTNGDQSGVGVFVFDGRTWTRPPINGKPQEKGPYNPVIRQIAFTPDRHVWLANEDQNTLHEYDGRQWTLHRELFSRGAPHGVAVDSRGRLWVAIGDGVAVWDRKVWRTFNGDPYVGFGQLVVDRKNRVWCFGEGVCCFDGRSWKTYTIEGLTDKEWLFAVADDDRGRVWLGTSEGLFLLEEEENLP